MAKAPRSADGVHGAKGNSSRITKASKTSDVTPNINLNPSIADMKNLPLESGYVLNEPCG